MLAVRHLPDQLQSVVFAHEPRQSTAHPRMIACDQHSYRPWLLHERPGIATGLGQAAAVLGCSRVAMRARLSRAQRRLAHILEAEKPTVTQAHYDSRAVQGGAECGVIERSS